jgi:ABC-type Fe3+-hydroxamate transport system substrate-binding protein
MRVISCVPSISELIFFLRPEALLGRTRYCIYPNEIKSIPSVGGTKKLDLQMIEQLNPDVIIAVKEENEKEQIDSLALKFPVKVFDIKTLKDALNTNLVIARLLDAEIKLEEWTNEYKEAREKLSIQRIIKAVYLIWKNPLMTIGNDTFIHAILKEGGFENQFQNKIRYPETTFEEIEELNPEVIFLSSEPFPFREKQLKEFQTLFPSAQVLLVDGTYFSWYGSRLSKTLIYLDWVRNQISSNNQMSVRL